MVGTTAVAHAAVPEAPLGYSGATPSSDFPLVPMSLPRTPEVRPRGTGGRLVRAAFYNLFELIPAQAYQDKICHFRFGGKNFVHVADPDVLTDILVDQPELYEKGESQREVIENTRGYGPLSAKDAEWSKQRKMFASFFQPRFVARTEDILDTLCERAAVRIGSEPNTDVLDEIQRAVLLSVYGSLFPELIDADDVKAGRIREELLEVIRLAALAKARMSRLPESMTPGLMRKRSTVKARALGDQMDQHMARAVKDIDLKIRANPDGLLCQILHSDAVPDHLKMEYLRSMFMSGQYPTESFLSTMFTLLAMNPTLQERLRVLLLSTEPDADDRFKTLLEAFEMECLRLFPPAPLLERDAPADRPSDHWTGEAQSILISPWVIHRHRQLWGSPDRFDLERFDAMSRTEMKGRYLPFGMGKRSCSGQGYAHMIADKLVRSVLTTVRLEAANGPYSIRSKQALEFSPHPVITATPL